MYIKFTPPPKKKKKKDKTKQKQKTNKMKACDYLLTGMKIVCELTSVFHVSTLSTLASQKWPKTLMWAISLAHFQTVHN